MVFDIPRVLEGFDTAVARLRERHDGRGPGFSIALLHDGQPIRAVHHGHAQLEWQQPLAGSTRFYLASESKPWVAALVMDAVAAGRIALDADMRRLLPALADSGQPVRLGHLLRHTSGLDDYLYLWRMQLAHDEDDLVTQAQALALILRSGEVNFEPGTRHDYSNSNYVLLADWLERDTGLPLAEIARRRFFEPWGLHDTSFEQDPRRVLPRRAQSYKPVADGTWQALPVNLATWGDGGMWSTLDDLVRAEASWLEDWRRHGGGSLLACCATQDSRFGPEGHPYGFGVEVIPGPRGRLTFHGGSFAGFSSLILRNLDHDCAVIVLSNAEGFDASASTWSEHVAAAG